MSHTVPRTCIDENELEYFFFAFIIRHNRSYFLIWLNRIAENILPANDGAAKQSHTVVVATADEHGNACAFINSIASGAGCAVVEDHGFVVQVRWNSIYL